MIKCQSMQKVFVAMSGGVDSSVAAALLKERGFEVVGVHLKCYNLDGCGEKDAEDARRVAEQLNIPFYVFDLEKEYQDKVVRYMIDGYRAGLTPNPDVMCNKEIKFGLFFKKAIELGADYVATGHYVRLKNNSLYAAKDKNKDQSYFLWTLTAKQLERCLFPIGEYTKPQVRKLAKKFGIVTAEKKDSQGICFLGRVNVADFLKQYLPEKRGLVLNTAGEKIGEHRGAHFYTIGQRHGFDIRIKNYQLRIRELKPHYVTTKDIQKNTLTVATGENNPNLYKKEINLTNINFINPIIHDSCFIIPVYARVRYRQPLVPATLNTRSSQDLKLILNKPQKFIAPGQSAVFYSKNGGLLGGGVIL